MEWIDVNLPRPLDWSQVKDCMIRYVCDWAEYMEERLRQKAPEYLAVLDEKDYKDFLAERRKYRTMEWFIHAVAPLLVRHVNPAQHTLPLWA
jgi:hypothetical protein